MLLIYLICLILVVLAGLAFDKVQHVHLLFNANVIGYKLTLFASRSMLFQKGVSRRCPKPQSKIATTWMTELTSSTSRTAKPCHVLQSSKSQILQRWGRTFGKWFRKGSGNLGLYFRLFSFPMGWVVLLYPEARSICIWSIDLTMLASWKQIERAGEAGRSHRCYQSNR